MSVHGLRFARATVPSLAARRVGEEDLRTEATARGEGTHQPFVLARLSTAVSGPARQRALQNVAQVRLQLRLVGDRASRGHTPQQHATLLAAHARLSGQLLVCHVSHRQELVSRSLQLFGEHELRVDGAAALLERRGPESVSHAHQGRDRREPHGDQELRAPQGLEVLALT